MYHNIELELQFAVPLPCRANQILRESLVYLQSSSGVYDIIDLSSTGGKDTSKLTMEKDFENKCENFMLLYFND